MQQRISSIPISSSHFLFSMFHSLILVFLLESKRGYIFQKYDGHLFSVQLLKWQFYFTTRRLPWG